MGIGIISYPGIVVSKKWKEASGILLVSEMSFLWYQIWYRYRAILSYIMNVRASIDIGIWVLIEH